MVRVIFKKTIKEFPFKIEKILTDNGSQFTYMLLLEHLRFKDKLNPNKDKIHLFVEICTENKIEHRLTKFRYLWRKSEALSRQIEIMNKVIKSYTTKKYFYENMKEFKKYLMSFILFYNHQKKLKSLKFKSPFGLF